MRWLMLFGGLLLLVLVAWVLLFSAVKEEPVNGTGYIDESSREKLEAVLEEADRAEEESEIDEASRKKLDEVLKEAEGEESSP